jgi:hypothetical protein
VTYHPDFDAPCRICGNSPCVVVDGHSCPDTELCGACFFHDHSMIDWSLWNNIEVDNEPLSDNL